MGEEEEEEEDGEGGGERGREEPLSHLPNLEASQDTELVVTTRAAWEEGEEEEERGASQDPESPRLTPRKANWSSQGNFRTS